MTTDVYNISNIFIFAHNFELNKVTMFMTEQEIL